MKYLTLTISLLGLLISASLFGEASVKLEGVHLCCKGCVRAVDGALSEVEGASAVADREAGTVVITAPDKKSLRRSVNSVLRSGFYGTTDDSSIQVRDISGAKDAVVETLTVRGVHLCCNGCVDAVGAALATVDGVAGNTAEKDKNSFEVVGRFNDREVFNALNKAGFAGRAGK